MPEALAWDEAYRIPVIVLGTTIICGTAHCLLEISFFKRLLVWRGTSEARANVGAPLLQRAGGVVLLGLIPASVAIIALDRSAESFGVTWHHGWLSLAVGAVGGIASLPGILLIIPRSPGLLQWYPEIRTARWTRALIIANAASWMVYLAAYEFFFRGFLLFPLVDAIGVWPAVVASSGLYSFSHFPKHPLERAVVTPGGIVFNLMALYTGSLIGPWVLHVLIAVSAEMVAMRANATSATRATGVSGESIPPSF